MIKKVILTIIITSIFFMINNSFSYNIASEIGGLLGSSTLVQPGDLEIGSGGFKAKIMGWVIGIGGFLGLAAIGAIVWGSFMMIISTGEEEKIKKAKDIVKWSILGFLGVIIASSLIALVINIMYDLGK